MAADPNQDRRELLKNALVAIEQLKAKVRVLETAAAEAGGEPIAIVGAGCRFPGGANGLDAYWQILRDGRDVVAEIPASRWAVVGDTNADPGWHASLVDDIDGFEPRFFGISAREATTMDPQQRMVLEVAWQALENAGYAPDRLGGSRTGVFLGITGHDYADLLQEVGGLVDVYAATGNANNAAAGRLSFILGLQGPSVAVDTACSSSLVAIHLACQSLRARDCRLAIAGGVNALLASGPFICFRSWGMMASDGQCKTFDARADGFVRGEGCGLIVLKRLDDARADGDRILAVIRGSAVNQDGRSSGLTVPNGPAQEAVIRRALEVARLAPQEIGFVEAHGTGTSLGDPIEAHALAAVYGEGRAADNPLVLGSVKTNLGHLESAAGVAGLLKVVLSLQHEHIPAHLHFTRLNPDIDFGDVPVEIPVGGKEWTRGGRPRFAGVSSFGFSGTNAHIVLAEAPTIVESQASSATPSLGDRPVHLLTLSARTESARDALADRFVQALSEDDRPSLADMCYTANTGRALQDERVAVVAATHEEMRDALAARRWMAGHARVGRGSKLALLFTGQGSQWPGMGRELYDTQPVFRAALDRCATILDGVLDVPLIELLHGAEVARLDETAYTQPALFALEWALAQLWQSWGIRAAAVFGHSVGEYVGLCVAGVWTVEDGLKLIAERGRLMQTLGAGWGMTAVRASRSVAEAALAGHERFVSLAAANAPESTVVSGRLNELAEVERRLASQGIETKRLTVSHAFHSPQMEPVADQFAKRVAAVEFRAPASRVVSSVTGREISLAELRSPDYWRRQVRNAVEFEKAINTLADAGFDTFVEVGPSATLTGFGRLCIAREGQVWAPSLRRDRGATQQILESVGQLHVHGADIDLAALDSPAVRKRVALPTYPFQRQRYWIDQAPRAGQRRGSRAAGHPLLGARFTIAGAVEAYAWESDVSFERLPYLIDHCVQGGAVVPATAYLEMSVAAGHEILGDGPIEVSDAGFFKPLFLSPGVVARVQVRYEQGAVQVHSRIGETAPWVLHAVSHVARGEAPEPAEIPTGYEAAAREEIGGEAFYALFHERGNQWGPSFQGVAHAWLADGEGWSKVIVPESLRGEMDRYHFHPAVADAAGHILAAVTAPASQVAGGGAFVGQGIERVTIYDRPRGTRLFAHARVTATTDPMVRRGDVRVFDEEGRLVSSLSGARLRYLEFGHEAAPASGVDDWFYGVEWHEVPIAESIETAPRGEWLIVADEAQRPLARALSAQMAADGAAAAILANNKSVRDALDRQLAGVIDLRALAGSPAVDARIAELLDLVRLMSAGPSARLWIVTRGVHAVHAVQGAPTVAGLWQAPLWGIGRTLAVEHTELFGGLVDLGDDADPSLLWRHLRAPTGEDQVALRDGRRFAARLERLTAPPRSTPSVRPDGTYIITGGLAGLGLEAARWLVQAGARRLMLLGRTPLPPRFEWSDLPADHAQAAVVAAIREFEAAGTSVHTAAVDIADADALKKLFGTYAREGWPPIRGVVHSAGVLRHDMLLDVSPKDLDAVLRPKLGAWALEQALGDAPLDFFVMFSSASAVLSSPRLGAYAAANSFLDAFAGWRRAHGKPALSVNWGVWGQHGMASRFDAESVRALGERGMGAMRTDEGFDALGRAMTTDRANAAVLPVHWAQWAKLFPSYAASPLLSDVVGQVHVDRKLVTADRPFGILDASPEDRPALLVSHLAETLGAILGFSGSEVDATISISALGLDSLTAVEFKNRIAATLAVSLPTVRLLQGPTIIELATELDQMLQRSAPVAASGADADTAVTERVDDLSDDEVDAMLRELLAGGTVP